MVKQYIVPTDYMHAVVHMAISLATQRQTNSHVYHSYVAIRTRTRLEKGFTTQALNLLKNSIFVYIL